MNAVRFAAFVGTPLNQLLTVTWKDHPDFRRLAQQELERRLFRLLRFWLPRAGTEPKYAYFRENAVGRGPHIHLLLHFPTSQANLLRLEMFAHLHAKLHFSVLSAVDIRPASRPIGVVRYAAKALDPCEWIGVGVDAVRLGDFLGVDLERQAEVTLQRVGCTHNLDRNARHKKGYVDICDVLALQRAMPQPPAGQAAGPRRSAALV